MSEDGAALLCCFSIYSYLKDNLYSLSGSDRGGGQGLLHSCCFGFFWWIIIRREPRAPTTGEVRRLKREMRGEEGTRWRPPDGHQMNKLWWPPLGMMGSNTLRLAADSSISPQHSPIRWLLIMNEKLSAFAKPHREHGHRDRGLGMGDGFKRHLWGILMSKCY